MITQNRILFLIGLLILLVPFFGFPSKYESIFLMVAGLSVIILAFIYARNKRLNEIEMPTKPIKSSEVFVESRPRFASDDEEPYTDLASIKDRSNIVKTF